MKHLRERLLDAEIGGAPPPAPLALPPWDICAKMKWWFWRDKMHYGSCAWRGSVFGGGGVSGAKCQSLRHVPKQLGALFCIDRGERRSCKPSQQRHCAGMLLEPKCGGGFSRFAAHRCFGIQRGRIWFAGAMGAFDGPTAPALDLHIFVGEKGDDDQICDRLPQNLA